MTESQLQFRVGLLVTTACLIAAGLVLRFGEMRWLWERYYPMVIHFDKAPGVQNGTPVRKNGIYIGSVRQISFDETRGGVNVRIELLERHKLRKDSLPSLSRSILGDATIEFSPGKHREFHRPGDRVDGIAAEDPLEMVARVESQVSTTLKSFEETSREWQQVGRNLNNLVDTKRGNLDVVIDEAAESLHEFTLTMRNANRMLGDPQNQQNLRDTLAALPQMMEDTRLTIQSIRVAVTKADASLTNLSEVTVPLARRSNSIVTRLDNSVGHMELLLAELNQFSRALNKGEGSLGMLISDPQLYRNLDQSAAALQTLLKNLDPVVRDMRIFSDKVARHPELIGVGGAFKGSSGLK
jgi:phospholipid/cholesterol/gamma-HCH transport system substrate-binding protein